MEIRKEATYTENFGRVKMLFYVLPPLFALFGHILYRQRRIGLVLNSASVILAMLLTVQFLHKGMLVFFVAKLSLLEMYLTGVSARRILKLGVTAFVTIIGMYVFYTGYVDQRLMINILHRIFVAYVEILEFVLSMWPEQYEYFWGVTFPNPRGIFPYVPVNLSGEVFTVLRGGTGNAPVPSFGEGYVNFGFIGVFVIVGFITSWLLFLVTSFRVARRDPLWLAIWMILAFDVNAFGRTSFFGAFNLRTIAVIILIITFTLFIRAFIAAAGERHRYVAN